ncbi:DUF6580 family putative transport protein [Hydrotalea sp.]|uniref:DUF6580 family putative transport protein n=1 Tax=Hydrotalea sp. TaxID=2881279 RepID=UPI002630CEE3|nr:DUF6580 family putative transport protein [Hydrotalea sp.]
MQFSRKNMLYAGIILLLTLACKLVFANNIAWSGFSPVMAIAIVAGMMVHQKHFTFIFPLVALLGSDMIIQLLYVTGQFPFPGIYSYQLLNYMFLSVLVIAGWMLKGKNYTTVTLGALAGPAIYFLLSNFTVWATHGGYNRPMNATGLWMCMVDGLPFYKNSLMATLLFVPVLLMVYHGLIRKKLAIKLQ